MKVRTRNACISAAVAALMCAGGSIYARDLAWDANGADAPLGQDGGGNWDLTSPNWVDGDLVTGTNTVWSNGSTEVPVTPPDSAIFGNATNAPVAGALPNNVDFSAAI